VPRYACFPVAQWQLRSLHARLDEQASSLAAHHGVEAVGAQLRGRVAVVTEQEGDAVLWAWRGEGGAAQMTHTRRPVRPVPSFPYDPHLQPRRLHALRGLGQLLLADGDAHLREFRTGDGGVKQTEPRPLELSPVTPAAS
jgi:hypothetical protein